MRIRKSELIYGMVVGLILIIAFFVMQTVLNDVSLYLDEEIILSITKNPVNLNENNPQPINETIDETAIPGVLSLNDTVIVGNTEGDGLLIRSEPGIGASPLFWGAEGETFIIIDGPQISGNSIWWRIKSISEEEKIGWANHEYLIRQ